MSKTLFGLKPELHPISIIRMVWKQRFLITLVSILAGTVGAIVVYRLPRVYRASVLILMDSQKIPEKYVASMVTGDTPDRLNMTTQQVLSRTRLEKLIQDYNLYPKERGTLSPEEVVELLRNNIKVKLESGGTRDRPGAFRVSFTAPDAVMSARIANELGKLFIDENIRTREVRAEGTSEFLQEQLDQAKTRLDEQEAKVNQYTLAHNGELPKQETALTAALGRLQLELQANQDAISRIQQNKAVLVSTLGVTEGSGVQGQSASSSSDIKESDEEQLEALRLRYSDEHPEIKRLRASIAERRERQNSQGNNTASAGNSPRGSSSEPSRPSSPERREVSRARDRVAGVKAQVTAANRELKMRNQEQKRILADIAKYQARLDNLPIREQEMAALTRDYEISKANYRSLLERKLAAEMATDMEKRQKAEKFAVIDSARVPEKPFQPQRGPLLVLSSVLSLAVGLAAGLGRELKRNTILGEWELPSDVYILGRIPRFEQTFGE